MVVIEGRKYKDWALQFTCMPHERQTPMESGIYFFDTREEAEEYVSEHGFEITHYILGPTEDIKDDLL